MKWFRGSNTKLVLVLLLLHCLHPASPCDIDVGGSWNDEDLVSGEIFKIQSVSIFEGKYGLANAYDVIQRIETTYLLDDNSLFTVCHGDSSGTTDKNPTLTLVNDEHITEMQTKHGAVVDSVRFKTNLGTDTGVLGGSEGSPSTFSKAGFYIKAFVGQSGGRIERLDDPVYQAISATTQAPTRSPTQAPTRSPTQAPVKPPTKPPTGPPTQSPIAPQTGQLSGPPAGQSMQPSAGFATELPTSPPFGTPPKAPTATSSVSTVSGQSNRGLVIGAIIVVAIIAIAVVAVVLIKRNSGRTLDSDGGEMVEAQMVHPVEPFNTNRTIVAEVLTNHADVESMPGGNVTGKDAADPLPTFKDQVSN